MDILPAAGQHDGMRNRIGLSLTATVTLALGIGASVAVITVAEALLLKPLPVMDEERLALLWGETPDGKFSNVPLTLSELESFQRQARTVERVAYHTFRGASPVAFRAGDQPLQLDLSLVSGNYFDILGARPVLGRALGTADDAKGVAPVLVLSHHAWRQRFAGDSAVIGRTLTVAATGHAYQVVGVMPPGLEYPRGVDVWTPLSAYSSAEGFHEIAAGELDIVARLADGAALAQAASELTNFFATLPAGGFRSEARGIASGFRNTVLGDARPAMRIVLLASLLLLVVACINVANLQLVRALARIAGYSAREYHLNIRAGYDVRPTARRHRNPGTCNRPAPELAGGRPSSHRCAPPGGTGSKHTWPIVAACWSPRLPVIGTPWVVPYASGCEDVKIVGSI
jgi:hypothetical protein